MKYLVCHSDLDSHQGSAGRARVAWTAGAQISRAEVKDKYSSDRKTNKLVNSSSPHQSLS